MRHRFLQVDVQQHGRCPVQVTATSTTHWHVEWIGGPGEPGMRDLLARLGPDDDIEITLRHHPAPTIAAIVHAAARHVDGLPDTDQHELLDDLADRLRSEWDQHGYIAVHGMSNMLLGRDTADPSPLPL